MEAVNFLSALVMFTLMCGVMCDEDIQLLNDRLDALSNRFDAFEKLMFSDKSIIFTKQEERILSLKAEMRSHTRQHVKTSLSEIMQGESFEDIIKSEVVSEMRHLKRTNHQMRRQLHQMMTSLGQVREDNRVYGEALLKGERENAELMSCCKCHVKSELLTVQLAEHGRLISELKRKLSEKSASCTPANKTNDREADSDSDIVTQRLIKHDNQSSQLNINRTLMTLSKESGSALNSSTQTSSTSTTLSPSTSVPTQLTTPDPQEERSRILVAPMWSSSSHQLRQLNIYNNSLDIYSYLNLKNVLSVVYIYNSLLIGLSSPYKIISSELHTSRVVTVRHNVGTYGMAADEKRGIIFLTTVHPRWTISRMSLQGRHYTAVVSLSGYGRYPRAIAVHPDTQVIYSCNDGKLFSVRYDGSRLTSLDTGSSMYAVTLDISNSLLYYSKYKKLMKMSLSTNTTSEVAEFSFYIWNLIYYRDTVYYISISRTLGAVDVGNNGFSYTLQTVQVSGVNYYIICLMP